MKNFWGSYDDRAQEEIEEEQREDHYNYLCEGPPFCPYCLTENEETEIIQRDSDDLINHVNDELEKEQK